MLKAQLPYRLRAAVVLLAGAIILLEALAICGSLGEAAYFAAVPCFVVYGVLFRREAAGRLSWRHAAYAVALAGLVGAYLAAYGAVTPGARVRWVEWPAALYFLAAIHILIWLLDRLVHRGVSAAIRIASPNSVKVAGGPAGAGAPRRGRREVCLTAVRILVLVLLGVPLAAAALTTHWLKFAEATDPRRLYGLRYDSVGFEASDGVRLSGWYIPCEGTFNDAAVILAPGRGMTKSSLLPLARTLRDNRYNVLLLDLRGEGSSQGHSRGFGVLESRDVLGALRYLEQAHPRESRQVFAVGISQGASAVLAAARADPRIAAVVLDSVFPSPEAELASACGGLSGPAGWYFRRATLLLASAQLGCDLLAPASPGGLAALSPRPVLLIHGEADTSVPVQAAEELYASAAQPAMLWKVPGGGHGESAFTRGQNYGRLVTKVFNNVRLGMAPFAWAAKAPAEARPTPARQYGSGGAGGSYGANWGGASGRESSAGPAGRTDTVYSHAPISEKVKT